MFLIWDKQRDSQWKEFGKWLSATRRKRYTESPDRVVISLDEIQTRHMTIYQFYDYMEDVLDYLSDRGSINIVKDLDERSVPEFFCDLPVVKGKEPPKRKIIL